MVKPAENEVRARRRHRLLALGFTLGPFAIAGVDAWLLSLAGWPRFGGEWDRLALWMPALGGIACIVLRFGGARRPWLIGTYAVFACLLSPMLAVSAAMMFGAPK